MCKLAGAAGEEEHHEFARIALDSVLTEWKAELHPSLKALFFRNDSVITSTSLWNGKSFADVSVAFSENDLSFARSHKAGRSIFEQLKSLPPSLIENTWRAVESDTIVKSLERKDKNVVVNYLLHHLVALQFANRAGEKAASRQQDLKLALRYEAIALSYLVDAFSSAHIFIHYKFLSWLQTCNYRKAHSFFQSKGAFVINSKGEVWQTFGDRLMLWYEPTYRHVLNAATTSLHEVLLVFHSAVTPDRLPVRLSSLGDSLAERYNVDTWLDMRSGGQDYYTILKMPSLLHLPMPVTATWSKKDIVDKYGIHQRIHYPQLREKGFHDPDLEETIRERLWKREAIPNFLDSLFFQKFREEFPEKHKKTPKDKDEFARTIVRDDTNFASVRFIQPREFLPSYFGLLVNAAGGGSLNGDLKSSFAVGLGFGILDNLLFLNNVSTDLVYQRILANDDRHFYMLTLGGGISLPTNFVKAFRIELGPATEKFRDFGYKIAAGIELPMVEVPFTYAGLTSRIMVQRIFAGSSLHGVYFQIVLH